MRCALALVRSTVAMATMTAASQSQAQDRSLSPIAPSLPGQGQSNEGSPAAGIESGDAIDAADPLPESREEQRWVLLEQELQELRDRLQKAEDASKSAVSPLSVTGYVDLGFFAPLGNNGVGFVRDAGNRQLPQFANYGWTFLGDVLGSPINSRGEAADLGDPPAIDRFDSVDSDGAPGFIVNEVNLSLGYTLADDAIMRASVNFMPRSPTQDFAIGDFLEVDLAELEYVLTDDGQTSLFVGKILPVFGIEYRDRKSNQRFGKVRSKLLDNWLIVAASATNNTSTVEQFHFYREVDRNIAKTLNGRAAISIPLDVFEALEGAHVELGVSGEWGAQDNDTRSDREIWFVGADLEFQSTNFSLKAQIMQGEAPGTSDDRVWALDLSPSGYVEMDWQAHSRLGLLLRADMRDAFVHLGNERAYVTNQARFTGGLRWLFNPHMIMKAEYYHNQELGKIEQFGNDMVTSSLLLMY
jgi:hypothetical protein